MVICKHIDPKGALKKDTLECILAQKDGKWLGSGLGDIWDIQCQFKSYRFLKQGMYTFEIEQAMRHGDLAKIEQLPGIMEIGLRIEKQNINDEKNIAKAKSIFIVAICT